MLVLWNFVVAAAFVLLWLIPVVHLCFEVLLMTLCELCVMLFVVGVVLVVLIVGGLLCLVGGCGVTYCICDYVADCLFV